MKMTLACALACAALVGIGSEGASACGDKFLLVGRGVRFERAYAAIHPASILIVLPLKSVKAAAVRDSQLVKALRMAGHRVDVVQQPANVSDVIERSHHDIILAERADASTIRDLAAPGAPAMPSIVGVLESPSPAVLAEARQQFEFVLSTPQSLGHILYLMDDVMKARLERARRTAAPGS